MSPSGSSWVATTSPFALASVPSSPPNAYVNRVCLLTRPTTTPSRVRAAGSCRMSVEVCDDCAHVPRLPEPFTEAIAEKSVNGRHAPPIGHGFDASAGVPLTMRSVHTTPAAIVLAGIVTLSCVGVAPATAGSANGVTGGTTPVGAEHWLSHA